MREWMFLPPLISGLFFSQPKILLERVSDEGYPVKSIKKIKSNTIGIREWGAGISNKTVCVFWTEGCFCGVRSKCFIYSA